MHTFKRSAMFALAGLLVMAGCAGEDGKDGVDGQSCTVVDNGTSVTITCPGATPVTVNDGVDGTPGIDGTDCTIVDTATGAEITCGTTTIPITDGTDAPIPPGAGYEIEIVSATAPAAGQPTVTFKVTDAAGNLLNPITETGARPSWVISQLNADGTYTSLFEIDKAAAAYVDGTGATVTPTNTVTQAAGPTATAPVAAANPGEYTVTLNAGTGARYTAATQTATVTVAAYAARTFDGVAYPAAADYSFVPAGGTPAIRQVVTDAACNACHKNLTAHGRRRSVALCLTCHSPQTSDPESDNTVDMRVMIHKIHAGQAGYFIVGYQQHLYDYSHVVFPDLGNGVKNCNLCHGGAAQAITPSIVACQSCHTTLADTHGSGLACSTCHNDTTAPTPAKAHSPLYSATANTTFTGRQLDIQIVSVDATNKAAPRVRFTVKTANDLTSTPVAADIKTNRLSSFAFTVAGPTSDYGSPGGPVGPAGNTTPPTPGYVQSVSYATAANAATLEEVTAGVVGEYWAALPDLSALADGVSIAVGVEAYITETGTCATAPCATKNWTQKATAVKFAAITSGTAKARRTITTNAKCNACHVDLGFHGGAARKTPEYCAFCHNPTNVNEERVSRYEVFPSTAIPYEVTPESVSIGIMAHKLHAGGALSNTYTLGTDRSLTAGTPDADATTFAGLFPGDLGDCQTCHAAGTYGLPSADALGLRQATYTCVEDPAIDSSGNFCGPDLETDAGCTEAVGADTDDWCEAYDVTAYWQPIDELVVPPQTAACTSCHDSDAAKGHALLNTTLTGVETCAVCHGAGATYDALQVHQPAP